ncbi:hypothetical protein [Cryobacterium sp. Y62]|uniref:hypothetical protein n=1 Tax=Cryobacterium sp. Y62 TaxID=2048284 RepID=UPI000CE4F396|nr:hypothetical protein [Cryobacterium sp. Y62]
MEFSTLQTTLPISDLQHAARARKIAERLDDLRADGRRGYTLASTLTVTGTNYATIIDTLTKDQTK